MLGIVGLMRFWVYRAILPLLGEYVDSGYREPKGRLLYSIRSNARYQFIVLCCALVGLIYVSIQNGFEFTSIKALVMALAYVWGLVLAIYLMGHGLVSIPRTLFRNANVSERLRRIQAHAPRVHDRLMDAISDLECLESQVAQLQRRKTGTARDFQEWIDELAETATAPELRTAIHESDERARVPAVITERYLADLTRRLQRARHQKARFMDEWDRLVVSAADIQAIINSSASKKLDFAQFPRRSSFFPGLSSLTPYMRHVLYVNVLPGMRLVLGGLCTAASFCIIWSELIKSVLPRLSIISLTVTHNRQDPKPVGLGGQVTASAWLLYMCSAALVGVNDAKVWGNRALVRRNTYGESACWYAGLVARLTVPIAYNFLTFLPENTRQHTTFYLFLGRLIDLTPLGKGFDYFFPVLVLLPVCATLFNFYGRVKNICGLGLAEEETEDLENNPSGYGVGGWREGRELIDRELSGLGSLALTGRANRSTATWQQQQQQQQQQQPSRAEGLSRAFSSSTTSAARTAAPDTTSTRPSGSARGSPATAVDEDEDDENFFQEFAHRVKNTWETSSTPQWFQGEPFRLPRWMSGDGDGSANNPNPNPGGDGVTRLFGGRSTNGGLRL